MQSIGEALATAQGTGFGRRTGSKVWANSKTEVGQEGRLWRPFNKRHAGRILKAAERYDRIGRLSHRRDRTRRENGPLGHVALDVLRYLLSVIDHKTGALYPAVRTIADRCGRSTAAVHDALKRLRAHGFLTWVRRFTRTGNAGLRGPQVEQASNAYAITLPEQIAKELDAQEAPPPDDDTQRRAAEAQERLRMVASLRLADRMADAIDNPELAAALARLGAGLKIA